MAVFVIADVRAGTPFIWLYAAIRPRFRAWPEDRRCAPAWPSGALLRRSFDLEHSYGIFPGAPFMVGDDLGSSKRRWPRLPGMGSTRK